MKKETSIAPELLEPLSDKKLPKTGEEIKLVCKISGYPKPEVNW